MTRVAARTSAVQTIRNIQNGPRLKKLLSSSAIMLGMMVIPMQAALAVDDFATPVGEQVVGGAASFDRPSEGLLNVTQNTDRVVINWDSFNIGSSAKTEFFQPGSSSLAVNRVTGKNADPTQILGTLKANGQVMVLDRNGVIFGKDSVIDVGGIVASTGDVDDDAVMRGDRNLDLNNFGDGEVVNNGLISVADEGLAAFVAPTVVNNGVINAKLGKVALSTGGERATIDLYGDGLVEIALDSEKTKVLARNSGAINAEGGTVAITASAAKEAVDDVINMDGVVRVSSVTVEGGKIVLSGGKSGKVSVSGELDASGAKGGKISVTGENVNVSDAAALKANANENGDGGDVTVIAQDHADFRGKIYARGGKESGNGGSAEVSGLGFLGFSGFANLGAAHGSVGTLLLDPKFAVIHSGAGSAGPAYDTIGTGVGISAQALADSMAASNVVVQADNFIDVGTQLTPYTNFNAGVNAQLNALADGAINLSLTSGAVPTVGSLTLQSNKINFNRDLTMGAGNVSVDGNTVNLAAYLFASDSATRLGDARLSSNAGVVNVLAPTASIQQGVELAASGATVNVAAGTYNESLDINKSVNLKGAKANVAGDDASRGVGETIIDGTDFYTDGGVDYYYTMLVNADNVTINGFDLIGDGASTADDSGIETSNANNLSIKNNIIEDTSYAIYAYGGIPTKGEIKTNYVKGADGQAIHTRENQYFDITNNKIDTSAMGITTENFSTARADGLVTNISNNTISASKVGIRNNLSYGTQTGFKISGNTITAENPAETRRWAGIEILAQQAGVATLFQNNHIDGSAVDAARQTTGYEITNVYNPGQTVINDGTIQNVDTGIWATDGSFYTGVVSDLLIKGVTFSAIGQDNILVEDTSDASNDPALNVNATGTTVTIGAGNNFNAGAAHNVTLVGSKAKVLLDSGFSGLNNILVKAANAATNYTLAPYGTSVTLSADNASIQAGIDAVKAGGKVDVEAGSFAESLEINKSVNLRGAKAGVAGDDASRGTGETILDGTDFYTDGGVDYYYTMLVDADNVTIDGFDIVGDGALTADDSGIEASNSDNLSIKNNIIEDTSYGIFAYGGTPTKGLIQNNYVTGSDAQAIHTRDNQYFDILNNKVDNSGFGIVMENFSTARADGLVTKISGNVVSASKIGIRNNLSYGTQSGFKISGNTIRAENSAETRRWAGIEVLAQQGGVATLFQNNDIDGSAVDAARQTTGYEITNIYNPGQTTISGGTIQNVDTGIWATDGSFYTGIVSDLLIKGVTFVATGENDILIEDTSDLNNDPAINVNATGTTVTIGAGNIFSGGAMHNVTLVGSKATALLDAGFSGVKSVLVKAASAATNYTLAPYGATTTLSADNASIQKGIDAVKAGGTVDVEAGTFDESLEINKSVNLRGAKAGVAGDDASRGTGETIVNGTEFYTDGGVDYYYTMLVDADNVTIDGFDIIGDGALTADDSGIEASNSNNLSIKNNIIEDASYGIFAYGGTPTKGEIAGNYVTGSDGQAIHTRDNQYFDILSNKIDNSAIGITTENFSNASPDGLVTRISGNTIAASKVGIRNNLSYGTQTGFKISGNTITAENSAETRRWAGIEVLAQQAGFATLFQNNNIDGSAVDATRQTTGYEITNVYNPSQTVINDGIIQNVDTGVWATDGSFYTGVVNNLLIKNITFSGVGQNDILIEDTSDLNNDPAINVNATGTTVTIGEGNHFSGGAIHNVTLVGSKAKALLDAGFGGVSSVLVKAASATTNYTAAPYGTSTTLSADNASIQAGVNVAKAGGKVDVEAGNFNESVVIDRSVNLRAAKAGVAGDDASRGTNETILDGDDFYTDGGVDYYYSILVNADNVTIDGFDIVGDGALTADDSGIESDNANNLSIKNNIIEDTSYAIYAYGGTPTKGSIRNNYITGADGQAIHTRDNQYFDIISNTIDNSAYGVTTENFSTARADGLVTKISNNTISASKIGIRNNLSYGTQSGFEISNNTITAEDPSEARRWTGIDVISQQGGVATVFSNNKIDGSGAGARSVNGYELTNIINPNQAVIDGGTIKNVDAGIWATDGSFYAGAVNDLLIKNVKFVNTDDADILVEDVSDASLAPGVGVNGTGASVTIGDGNIFSGGVHNLTLVGGQAKALLDAGFDGVSTVLVKAANAVTHYVANAPYSNPYNADNASIQAGVNAAGTDAQVDVEAGNYSESVTIGKSLKLFSLAGRNSTTITGSAGSDVITISGASDVQIGDDNGSTDNGFTIEGGRNGVVIDGGNGGNVVVGNIIRNQNKDGVRIKDVDVNPTIVALNEISGQGDDGVEVDGGNFVGVFENSIDNVGGNGVSVGKNSAQILVAANDIGLSGTIGGAGVALDKTEQALVAGNAIKNTTGAGINITRIRDVEVSQNTLDDIGGAGISLADSRRVQIDQNDIGLNGAVGGDGLAIDGSVNIEATRNNISGVSGNGIQASTSDRLRIANNVIENSGAAGLFLSGGANGSIVLRGNDVTSLAGKTGAIFESGEIDLTGTGTRANTFTGGETGLRFATFDPANPLVLVDSTIGETIFDLQTGNYVEFANGAFFAPGNPSQIDGTRATYDGFRPDSVAYLTTAQYGALDSKILDYNDDKTLGLFYFGSVPDVSEEDIFDAFSGFDAASRGLSITIRGLPRLPGQIGGGAAFNLASISPAAGGSVNYANIEPAAGGDDNSGANYAGIEPAAGGNEEQSSCWADAAAGAAGGATVTYNFGGDAESDLSAEAGCSSGN